ncbi:MAG: hypothetical protein M0Z58_08410 [Nitrospiraceae bacterium]|nr:hypothetical protein [Nitrospiraceae bacterium]
MAIAADIKRLTEDITSSHDARTGGINSLVENTHRMLADSERRRIMDFKTLHNGITAGVRQTHSEVASMLGSFREWNVRTAQDLKKTLERDIAGIKSDVAGIKRDAAGFLGGTRADLREASKAWNRMTLDISRGRKGKAGRKQKTAAAQEGR